MGEALPPLTIESFLSIDDKPIGASPGRDYEDGIISTYYILWSRQYIISKKGGNAPRATD